MKTLRLWSSEVLLLNRGRAFQVRRPINTITSTANGRGAQAEMARLGTKWSELDWDKGLIDGWPFARPGCYVHVRALPETESYEVRICSKIEPGDYVQSPDWFPQLLAFYVPRVYAGRMDARPIDDLPLYDESWFPNYAEMAKDMGYKPDSWAWTYVLEPIAPEAYAEMAKAMGYKPDSRA